jgi:hypothetical protein
VSDRQLINRLITTAARSWLRPHGLVQKGRSRTWYADRGWSLIVVEFQPGRGLGTYLNVGAMWLWVERDHWAFDEGDRLFWRADGSFTSNPPLGEPGWRQHVDFLNGDQFSRDVELVAEIAAGRVAELRAQFPTVGAVAERLASSPPGSSGSPLWHAFHGGVAAALSGDLLAAEQNLSQVVNADLRWDWEHDLAARASELLGLMGSRSELFNHVLDTIERSRRRLALAATTHLDDPFGIRS